MLRKIFIGMAFFLLAATQINLASAMSYGEMYLGGLTVGSTVDEMKRIYGETNSIQETVKNIVVGYYGNSIRIAYSNLKGYQNKIYSVTISSNNGWKTPSGLAVGDNISKALDICGNPDYTISGNLKTANCYFRRSYDNRQVDLGFIIVFDNDSGKILEMKICGDTPLGKFAEFYQDMMKDMVE